MRNGLLLRFVGREREVEPEPIPQRAYVRRSLAMLCHDCPALYESDGGNCPACGSPHAFPIAKWLDRTE